MIAPIGKLLIGAGCLLIVVGLVILFAPRLGIGRLPGDIVFQRGGTTFLFPIVTCILLSIVLSLVMSLLTRLRR